MGKIKNILYTNTALDLALVMALSFSGCGKDTNKTKSCSDIISIGEVRQLTFLDELIDAGYLKYDDERNLISASDRLEKYMQMSEMLRDIDFGNTQLTITSEEQQIYDEDLMYANTTTIRRLINDLKYKGDNPEKFAKRVNAFKELSYISSVTTNWVKNNGRKISEQLLTEAVKSSLAAEFNLGYDDYDFIIISGSALSSSSDKKAFTATVAGKEYTISYKEPLWDAIEYIYSIKGMERIDEFDAEYEFKTYRNAIQYSKEIIAGGVNLTNGTNIISQNSKSYVKSLIKSE